MISKTKVIVFAVGIIFGIPTSILAVQLKEGMAKGWKPSNSKELADLAERIGSGGRVVIKYPGRLGDKIKSELRALK